MLSCASKSSSHFISTFTFQCCKAATAWCKDMGAIWLSEVKENAQDLADHLELRPLERRRLLKALGSTGGKNAVVESGGIRCEDLFGPVVFHAFF